MSNLFRNFNSDLSVLTPESIDEELENLSERQKHASSAEDQRKINELVHYYRVLRKHAVKRQNNSHAYHPITQF